MCKCDPSIRTPYCGKLGCEWPSPTPPVAPKNLEELQRWIMSIPVPMEDWKRIPILANTGTMLFTIDGFEIKHGGPRDGAVVLRMGYLKQDTSQHEREKI